MASRPESVILREKPRKEFFEAHQFWTSRPSLLFEVGDRYSIRKWGCISSEILTEQVATWNPGTFGSIRPTQMSRSLELLCLLRINTKRFLLRAPTTRVQAWRHSNRRCSRARGPSSQQHLSVDFGHSVLRLTLVSCEHGCDSGAVGSSESCACVPTRCGCEGAIVPLGNVVESGRIVVEHRIDIAEGATRGLVDSRD